jgi:hypothetical protein
MIMQNVYYLQKKDGKIMKFRIIKTTRTWDDYISYHVEEHHKIFGIGFWSLWKNGAGGAIYFESPEKAKEKILQECKSRQNRFINEILEEITI